VLPANFRYHQCLEQLFATQGFESRGHTSVSSAVSVFSTEVLIMGGAVQASFQDVHPVHTV